MTPNAANILLKALSRIKLSSEKNVPFGSVRMREIDLQGVCQFEDSYEAVEAFTYASDEIKNLKFWYELHNKFQLVQYFYINDEDLYTYGIYYFHQYVYDDIISHDGHGSREKYLKHLGNNLC